MTAEATYQDLAEEFSLMADGQYNLKHSLKKRKDGVDICFYAGGYVEFTEAHTLVVIESAGVAWEIHSRDDFDKAIRRIAYFIK